MSALYKALADLADAWQERHEDICQICGTYCPEGGGAHTFCVASVKAVVAANLKYLPTLDALDEYDACDSWAGLPIEFFNPGPAFA